MAQDLRRQSTSTGNTIQTQVLRGEEDQVQVVTAPANS